jgi:hypothetical protein
VAKYTQGESDLEIGTSALNRASTSNRLYSCMEDVPMLIWIGIATAWVACLAVVVVAALVAHAPIMEEDPNFEEWAERIAEREARLKSRMRGAPPPNSLQPDAHYFASDFLSLTPGPPPFSAMNSTPAASGLSAGWARSSRAVPIKQGARICGDHAAVVSA